MALRGKRIAVCVGGGVAAFKAVELVRELGRRGAQVRVAMTPSATRFVGALTFSALTGQRTVTDLWEPTYAGEVHVELGAWADAMVVAPATMNLLARAAAGMADDAVLATVACARGRVLWAPAMHTRMWNRAATARNVETLTGDGDAFVGPVEGPLASGESGMGRMADPADIVTRLEALLGEEGQDLAGVGVLVTAGPTHEALDPVRFLGNRSSGKMGFALAERAAARGAAVTLVAGPVHLPTPPGVHRVDVRSARQMHDAVMRQAGNVDVVIMAAAVADYRPETESDHKLKKGDGSLDLRLVRNPDILADLGATRASGRRPVLVGFALETRDVVAAARGKRERKNADLIVANDASQAFGGDDNEATLVTEGGAEALPRMSKRDLSDRILDRAAAFLVR